MAIESPLQAITIWPPGTTNTLLPAEGGADGDEVGLGEPDPLSGGDGEPDADPEGESVGEAELVLGGAELGGGGGDDDFAGGGGGDVRAGGVGWCDVEALLVVAAGALVLGAGADELAEAFALAEADDAAAEAEFSLTCADTFAGEITRGVEPATSWPTRLTAVSVTAVTRVHERTQPMASVRGRPDHPRRRATTARRGPW